MDSRLVSPILMWAIVFFGWVGIILISPNTQLLQHSGVTLAISALAFLNWLYFFLGALWVNRSAARSAAGVKNIVTTGVYSRVRHPIYLGDILLAWSIALALGTLRVFIIAIWLSLVLYYWMGLEEMALEKKFGGEYRKYQKKVPKMFPRFIG